MTTVGDGLYQFGGVPVGGEFTTGDVFFVDSNKGSDSNTGEKPSTALASADAATNKCTLNTNNIVYLMPNHAETIASASTWVPDVAGVQYIGIGMGSDAPEFTFSATGSNITITGGNNTFRNIRFVAGISAVTLGVDVGVSHVSFENCAWDFSTTAFDFVTMLQCDSYDYLTVRNCRFIAENATAGSDTAIHLDAADHLQIVDNLFTGDYAYSVINSKSTDAAGVSAMITDNNIYNDDTASTAGAGISLRCAFTGIIARNMIGCLSSGIAADPNTIDPGSCLMFENYVCWQIDHFGVATLMGTATT